MNMKNTMMIGVVVIAILVVLAVGLMYFGNGITNPIYTTTTTSTTGCQNLYWFDNENTACGYKQFCGFYMYRGLQTFTTLQNCQNALASITTIATTTTSVPQTSAVTIQNFAFNPSSLTIKVGTTVTWTNQDSSTHTITSDSGNELNSGNIPSGQTYSHTFNSVGIFNYHCSIHTYMRGTITVNP